MPDKHLPAPTAVLGKMKVNGGICDELLDVTGEKSQDWDTLCTGDKD